MAKQKIRLTRHGNADKRSGISLIGVLIGIAILGMLASIVSSSINQGLRQAKDIAKLGEEEDLRRFLHIKVDCTQTLKALAEAPMTVNLQLLDSAGTPIAHADSNQVYKLSNVTFRAASRNSTTGAIQIFIKHPGQQEKDLYTNRPPLVCL